MRLFIGLKLPSKAYSSRVDMRMNRGITVFFLIQRISVVFSEGIT